MTTAETLLEHYCGPFPRATDGSTESISPRQLDAEAGCRDGRSFESTQVQAHLCDLVDRSWSLRNRCSVPARPFDVSDGEEILLDL